MGAHPAAAGHPGVLAAGVSTGKRAAGRTLRVAVNFTIVPGMCPRVRPILPVLPVLLPGLLLRVPAR
jgi:hypothetical protein